jgi:hypothetical protein
MTFFYPVAWIIWALIALMLATDIPLLVAPHDPRVIGIVHPIFVGLFIALAAIVLAFMVASELELPGRLARLRASEDLLTIVSFGNRAAFALHYWKQDRTREDQLRIVIAYGRQFCDLALAAARQQPPGARGLCVWHVDSLTYLRTNFIALSTNAETVSPQTLALMFDHLRSVVSAALTS